MIIVVIIRNFLYNTIQNVRVTECLNLECLFNLGCFLTGHVYVAVK